MALPLVVLPALGPNTPLKLHVRVIVNSDANIGAFYLFATSNPGTLIYKTSLSLRTLSFCSEYLLLNDL
jgi:hypothetical protein